MNRIQDLHEVQLDIGLDDGFETWGTCDRLTIYDNNTALLADYKTGVSQIDHPDENYQALAYTLGVFQKWPEIEKVTFVFYIPQYSASPAHTFTRDEVPEIRAKLTGVIRRASTTRPKWATGSVSIDDLDPNQNCRFCRFEDKCPALGFVVLEVAKKLDPRIPDVDLDTVDDPATVEALYNIAKIVAAWAERHKKRAVDMAKEGVEFPTLRLKSLGATSSVTDTGKLLDIAVGFGVSPEEALDIAMIPLGRLGKLVGDKAPKGKKAEMQRFFVDAVEEEGILQKSETRYTLS
jgi:hypothetical protein